MQRVRHEASTPPGVINIEEMEVNQAPRYRIRDVMAAIYYIVYGLVLTLICATSVAFDVGNNWLGYSIFGAVALLYFCGFLSGFRAYLTPPLRIPPTNSFYSLSCIRLGKYSTLAERVNAADNIGLQLITDDIRRIYGPYFKFRLKANRPQICTVCEIVQPHRTYHCNTCNRCVYRLDYHSWLLSQCIHYRNSKYVTLTAVCNVLIFIIIIGYQLFNTMLMIDALINYSGSLLLAFVHLFIDSFIIARFIFDLSHLRRAVVSYSKNSLLHERNDPDIYELFNKGTCLQNTKESIGSVVWKWFLPIDGADAEEVIHHSLRLKEGYPVPSRKPGAPHKRVRYNPILEMWAENATDRAQRRLEGDISSTDDEESVSSGAMAGASGLSMSVSEIERFDDELAFLAYQQKREAKDSKPPEGKGGNVKIVIVDAKGKKTEAEGDLCEDEQGLLDRAEVFSPESSSSLIEQSGSSDQESFELRDTAVVRIKKHAKTPKNAEDKL